MTQQDATITNETIIRVHQAGNAIGAANSKVMAAAMVRSINHMLSTGGKMYSQDLTGYMSDRGAQSLAAYLTSRYSL